MNTMNVKKVLIFVIYTALFYASQMMGKVGTAHDVLLFSFGLIIGIILLDLDEAYLYRYYQESQKEIKQLVTRSLLFQLLLFPLGIFLMTSTGSPVGIGIFLSITAMLSLELLATLKNNTFFEKRFMYQLKKSLDVTAQKHYTILFLCMSIFFLIFTIFLGR